MLGEFPLYCYICLGITLINKNKRTMRFCSGCLSTFTLFILFPVFIYSQGCLPEGIILNSQEDVNDFASNYPGCTVIEGHVQIGGSVYDLTGLNGVEVFQGDVTVYGSDLTDLYGLNEQVKIEGWLSFMECLSLVNLNGLQAIDSLPEGISVMESPAFTDLTGLENLVYAKAIDLSINESLIDITALNMLETVAYDLTFWENDALVSLEGLESLQYVGNWLYFMHNDNITNLDNLQNLTTVGSNFSIINNDALTDIMGLNSELMLEGNLKIKDNDNLSSCAALSICNYLVMPSGTITIENNAPGCNSTEEVEEDCTTCLPDGFVFTTQGQIDSFLIVNPYCSEVIGSLQIGEGPGSSDDILDLNPFSGVSSIGGDLSIIYNTALENLEGLNSLESVEGLLNVSANDSLKNIQGLNSLYYVGGDVHFQVNSSLINLIGLEGLSEINGDLYVGGNMVLENFSGLENITHVAGDVSINFNCLPTDCNGLNALESINGDLELLHNCHMISLDGLDSLITIGGELGIYWNDTISDISGIQNIDPYSINLLKIIDNKNLSACHIQNICDYIILQVDSVLIEGNDLGCNSSEEVEEACLTNIDEQTAFQGDFIIAPNPASNSVMISSISGKKSDLVRVMDLKGNTLFEETHPGSKLNISSFSKGLYLLAIFIDDQVLIRKLLVK